MHFQSKLHINSILTGSVDSYCLVCDNYLRSEDEAFTHTEKPIHKKNMGAATRVEKFLDDRIIKVKKGYYCPFCNILLSTTTKVSIHIRDTNHQEKKGAQVLRRVGDNIIAFDEVAITLESWHGLMDNTCLICNMEFDEENLHRTDQGHVLKLVQSRCEFGDKYVYRKVDEDSFFCLICACVFSINEKLNHHENTSHKDHYNSGKSLKNKNSPQIKIVTKSTPSKPENTITSDTVTRKPADDNTENVDTKTAAKNSGKDNTNTTDAKNTDKFDTKTNLQGSFSNFMNFPVNQLNIPEDGKMKRVVSRDVDTMTLYKNSVLANDKNHKKPEVNGTVAGNTKKAPINTASDTKKQSDILDRVEEFQKKGININFTWDKARCKHCNDDVAFDTTAIEKHIEWHNIKMKTDNIELITDPNKQVKKSDANSFEPKADKKKVGNTIEPKADKKKVDNTIEPKADNKKINNTIEPTHTNKTDNGIEQKIDSKQQLKKSDEVKSDTKKIDNIVPKQDSKKDKTPDPEVKTETVKLNNGIIGPKKQPKKSANLKPAKGLKKELETFAKDNNMVVMPNEAYCPLCKVEIALTKVAMTAHANSNSHKNKKPSQNGLLGKRVSTSESMETFIQVESNLGTDVILNNKYVLRQYSFHCIIMEDDCYKCMLCDADFTKSGEQLTQHMNGPDHKDKLGLCKIVSSLPEEFIREIMLDVYHCGYCNEVLDGWTEMQDHLSHSRHHYARRHAQWNLERCHSVTRNARLMQVSNMHAINYA